MYVVIFHAKIKKIDQDYIDTIQKLRKLALSQYGCTQFDACTEANTEIAISYWPDLHSIARWKQDAEHCRAQTLGKNLWYSWYQVNISKIERSYAHAVEDEI